MKRKGWPGASERADLRQCVCSDLHLTDAALSGLGRDEAEELVIVGTGSNDTSMFFALG